MIKVIASDMDGTLLGNDHKVAPETLKAIHEACDAGIRFMIATGRNFKGAMEELKRKQILSVIILSEAERKCGIKSSRSSVQHRFRWSCVRRFTKI